MFLTYFYILFIINSYVYSTKFCPKECDCDLYEGRNRAVCENQNVISVEIGVPSDVEIYDLSHNAVYEMESFQLKNLDYTSLQEFDLSYNNLVWIGINAFAGLHSLKIVNLSHNRLRAIAPDIFWDNNVIEEVDLSGNMFHMVKNVPFLSHTGLRILNLNECRIAYFPYKMFSDLPNLRSLDISENYNLGLTIATLTPMTRLSKLKIDNEYLRCTPELKELELWIVNRDISYKIKCKEKKIGMFERLQNIAPPTERTPKIIDDIWCSKNATINISDKNEGSLLERLNKIPSIWTFVMGLQIGSMLGLILTYFWLTYCPGKRKNVKDKAVRTNKRVLELRVDTQPFLTPRQVRAINLLSPKKNIMMKQNYL